MDYLSHVSPTLRFLLVFGFILFVIQRKWSLGAAFLSGATLLCFSFGLGPVSTLSVLASSVILPDTLVLSVMVTCILVFSQSMEKSGQMQRMILNFKGLIKRPGINLAIFPALIGLLPMPGGAIFSAPMVKELGQGMGFSNLRLSLVNYWFRHVWEYWWPLYPGVLLAIALSGMDMGPFVAMMFPFTLMALCVGFLMVLTPSSLKAAAGGRREVSVKPFVMELHPVLIIVAGGPLAGFMLSRLMPDAAMTMEAGLIFSLVLATVRVFRLNNMAGADALAILKEAGLVKMIMMVVSIMAFKTGLEAGGAVDLIAKELLGWNIPLVLIACMLPFMVGLVTGISVAFVGISLPILIPLVASAGEQALLPSFTLLVVISGFCGVLLSPLHLCLILSNSYFGAPMTRPYKVLLPLAVIMALFGIAAFYVSVARVS